MAEIMSAACSRNEYPAMIRHSHRERERENMTSHFITSYCESARRYPYVSTNSVEEDADRVDFIYQFVQYCYPKFKGGTDTLVTHHTRHYIPGAPIKFPDYGDFPKTFVMKPYGFDISISTWQNDTQHECVRNLPQDNSRFKETNKFIDLEFEEAVYPIRVSIYEIYNPGNIIEIWAERPYQNYSTTWFLLWDGPPQIVPPTSRLFSPPLKSCNFKTKMLRLKFRHSVFDYRTNIDAVMFIGTSRLILPKNPKESLTDLLRGINCMHLHQEDVHNLTADYENAHLDIDHLQKNFFEYCIIFESKTENSFFKREVIPDYVWEILSISQKLLKIIRNPSYAKHMKLSSDKSRNSPKHNQKLLGCPNPAKRMKLSSDETGELSRCSLSAFPYEIILKILKNLDLKTLCRMTQVNKHFNNLARDPWLYTRLNMRNIRCPTIDDTSTYMQNIRCPTYIDNMFRYFTSRCEYLQQLDLTYSDFFASDFEEFLENCGKRLTHLRLSKCKVINNDVLLKISKTCKNLKDLDLSYYRCIGDKAFSYLENLENLEHLNLGRTEIRPQPLCKILQKNKGICELNLDGIYNIDLDAVAIELKKSCRDLEIITLFSSSHITSQGINALADCKNLRKVNLQFKYRDAAVIDSLSRLFASCQRLEEVHLAGDTVLTNRDLMRSLTQCKNLKQLHFYDVNDVLTFDYTCSVILEQCPKLQELYLVYSCNISPYLRHQLQEKYPHVFIDIAPY